MTDPTPLSQIQTLSSRAIQIAAENYSKSLDYTDNSLLDLEFLLQQANQRYLFPDVGKGLSETELRNASRIWGAYLGEYMRRKWGGEWIESGENFDLIINGSRHSPIEQVYHRITHGKQYDLQEYLARIASEIASPRRPSKRSVWRKFTRAISGFWHSSVIAKIITIAAPLIILCCFCVSLPFVFPNAFPTTTSPAASTPSVVDTLTAATTQAPATQTFTALSIPSLSASLTPSFTFTFTPSSPASPIPTKTPLPAPPLLVHFIDVGQGNSILIQAPYGQTILIDGGDTNTGIVQYLKSLGVQRIDLMIATHPHADHIGGLVQVLQSFPVSKVVTNGELYTTSVYEQFLDAITAAKADYIELKRGDVLSQGGLDFHCLSPVTPTNSDPNENSLVLQFTYGKTTFLLMGDAGAATESDLLSSHLLSKVDILKVGHHGSTSGTTPAFLNVIKPDLAIYSAGLNNPFGHPAPQTIAALQAVDATIYGTDRNGTILVTADLNGYTAKPARLTSTPTPTRAATVPVSFGLTISSVTSPVSRGSNVTLSAKTSPGASCTITVNYKSGPSKASGLGPKTADSSGVVSWTWKVGSGTTLGTWPISVTCNGVTQTTTFTVR